MKVLYNHNNYLSDKINISSPCGGFSYLWSIFREFQRRNWEVYCSMDKDKKSVEKYGKECFSAFSQKSRWEMYNKLKTIGLDNCINKNFPDIDLLILEWRFKTKDNTLSKNESEYSPDLEIQNNILEYYKDKNIPLIILDLDYQLSEDDEKHIDSLGFKNVRILEQGTNPKKQIFNRETFYIPFLFDEMLQFPTPICNRTKLLVYVGNPGNREKDIEIKITPFARINPYKVHFYGNFMKDSLKEFREKNKQLFFHDRISAQEFRSAVGDAVAVPLLCPEEYKFHGTLTMRILESLLFGSIIIAFDDFVGIKDILPKELIVKMKDYDSSMPEVVDFLAKMPWLQRNKLRIDLINKLKEKHDVSHFVDQILK